MDWKDKAIDMTNKDILSLDFDSLVNRIQNTSDILQQDARVVINKNVTTRAWLTGFYIVEYEQHGNDRAKYGEKLLQNLSKRLDGKVLVCQTSRTTGSFIFNTHNWHFLSETI